MLHNEARELLVEGYARTHNAQEIAEAFGVKKRMVYRLYKQKCDTGSVELRTSQRGRKPLIGEDIKEKLRLCIDENPEITIYELLEMLKLDVGYSTLARVVHNMGYRVKKVSLHASEQERPRCAGQTCAVERTKVE